MQTLTTTAIGAINPAKTATVSSYARTVLAGATSIVIGILWDISWHRTIGRAGRRPNLWLAGDSDNIFCHTQGTGWCCAVVGFSCSVRGMADHLGLTCDDDLGSVR